MEFRYATVVSEQVEGGKRLVAFSAPAAEIDRWGGIPQKKRFDEGEESAGFQREDKQKRIDEIAVFLSDPHNILQNPLLCSERTAKNAKVEFVPMAGHDSIGELVITIPDYSSLTMLEVFERVQEYLEERVPSLKGKTAPEETVARLQLRARNEGLLGEDGQDGNDDVDNSDDADSDDTSEADETEGDGSTSALFEESHIAEFWEEVASRREVLKKIGTEYTHDPFLGFSREAMESYIRPVVVMDGQHRLRGALAAARSALDSSQAMAEAERRIASGESPMMVTSDLLLKASRKLPISLLLDPNPAEHVFQFVVVNQKATPIGRALLATIVSTSLSEEELETVTDRLQRAGIPLDESRAASYMARNRMSPFAGLVDLGMTGTNQNELLPWPVMVSLVQIFRDLSGAALYHQKNDYAATWRSKFLDFSQIVAGYQAAGFSSAYDHWRSLDGPWRGVFIKFWTAVRDFFGTTKDMSNHNYWGNPRKSNLFNKPSLHILAADFFRYMTMAKTAIENDTQVKQIVAEWLADVDQSYFNRDWKLDRAGVKKDSPGIRFTWSKQWDEYRTGPKDRLPDVRNFSKPTVV
jgi:hypothetical protein